MLVAASVALGTYVVSDAGRTERVWAAREALTPGDPLDGAVVLVDVTPAVAEHYLPADAALAGTVDRVVGPGELVPRGAVVVTSEVDLRSLVVDGPGTTGDLPLPLDASGHATYKPFQPGTYTFTAR